LSFADGKHSRSIGLKIIHECSAPAEGALRPPCNSGKMKFYHGGIR
jgi:hypothetical protein